MAEFLSARINKDPGNIVTTEGKVVGRHDGVYFYTIGQRRGIGVGGGTPYYVVEKRPETKELVVSSNYHPALFTQKLDAGGLNWFRKPNAQTVCQARIRYRQPVQNCLITKIENDHVSVQFDEPQRAVTPGQSIVFYDGEEMLGGGVIL